MIIFVNIEIIKKKIRYKQTLTCIISIYNIKKSVFLVQITLTRSF